MHVAAFCMSNSMKPELASFASSETVHTRPHRCIPTQWLADLIGRFPGHHVHVIPSKRCTGSIAHRTLRTSQKSLLLSPAFPHRIRKTNKSAFRETMVSWLSANARRSGMDRNAVIPS
jgi:hypothetical protein